jgi:hypothetical protein
MTSKRIRAVAASFKRAVAAFTYEEARIFGPYDPISRSTTVTVGQAPRLIAGDVSVADMEAVSVWIRLNEPALAAYWNYQIDTAQLIQRLQPYATH